MIRVLVVDDSPTVRARLRELLAATDDLVVVGEAGDGVRAVELARDLRPDAITLDLALPELDGLAATEHIMAHVPTPILIVSSAENRGKEFETYAALAAGAVDVLDKPHAHDVDWDERFIAAVRMVAKIRVITHPRARLGSLGRVKRSSTPPPPLAAQQPSRPEVIAIGASTGGPTAIATVLEGMPRLVEPTLVILHIDAPFARSFAAWLGTQTHRPVALAVDGERLDVAGPPGRVLFAPPDRHLVIEGRRVRLVDSPARHHCRPSIDTLFESLAHAYGAAAVACLLTGMGRDGAAGLLALRRAGGATLAQDEATSVVFGMPREALEVGAVDRVHALDDLGPAIGKLFGVRR